MFEGEVIHGDKLGKALGYPTANLNISPVETKLREGVYAVRAKLRGKIYDAALVVQMSPKKVEVHLLGYEEDDCYGERIAIEPIQKVSELEWFEDREELKKKIAQDIQHVQDILKEI